MVGLGQSMAGGVALSDVLPELLQWLWPALDDLPPDVIARAQRLWLDTASCAASGLQAAEPERWLAQVLVGDRGGVPLPGTSLTASPATAAMALALGACWDEACEGLAMAHGRPGVPVVAALWSMLPQVQAACASDDPCTWLQLWQATAAGYEVAGRLGAWMRIKPGMHVDGTWGAFGAAVAAVRLSGGSWQQAQQALETAASQLPFTLLRPAQQGANVRNLYLGHSAWLGLQAAQAILGGLVPPVGALDDVAKLMLAGAPAGRWVAPGEWLLLHSYWKPFAAVRHVHYGAQAALALRAQGLQPQDIVSLTLQVYPEALQYCANRAPATPLAAQFSLSFGVAAALTFGDLSPAAYRAPRFDDALLRQLEALVKIEAVAADPAAGHPESERSAVLLVHTRDRQWQHRQGAVVGDVGHEPDLQALQRKFDQYTQGRAAEAHWLQRLLTDKPTAPAVLPNQPINPRT
jgi:2-methylcitrate dehydratase PrpD